MIFSQTCLRLSISKIDLDFDPFKSSCCFHLQFFVSNVQCQYRKHFDIYFLTFSNFRIISYTWGGRRWVVCFCKCTHQIHFRFFSMQVQMHLQLKYVVYIYMCLKHSLFLSKDLPSSILHLILDEMHLNGNWIARMDFQ